VAQSVRKRRKVPTGCLACSTSPQDAFAVFARISPTTCAKSHLVDLLTSPYSQRAPSTSTLIFWPGRTRCRHHCHTKTTAARPERVMLSPGRRSNPSRLVNHSATPSSRTLRHAKFGRAALLPSSSRSSSTLRVRLPGPSTRSCSSSPTAPLPRSSRDRPILFGHGCAQPAQFIAGCRQHIAKP
jgi:hypothetical protein